MIRNNSHLDFVDFYFCPVSSSKHYRLHLTLLNSSHFLLEYLTSRLRGHTFLCRCSHKLVRMFARMPIDVDKNKNEITSSTLKAVLAEVSIKMSPFSLANLSPSSYETCLRASRSHLFPISIIVMSGFPFYLTSSNHLVKWLKVSLLLTHYSSEIKLPCNVINK